MASWKTKLTFTNWVQQLRGIALPKLAAIVLFCVILLQFAVFLQHGEFKHPLEFPIPIIFGILLGTALGISEHIIQSEKKRARNELAEKEQVIEALAISEARLTLAVNHSHIWDWDVVNDDLYLSPGFAKSLGYTEEELAVEMSGTTANLLHADDVERYRAKMTAHFEDPSKGFLNEHRFRTKSGQYQWFLSFGHSETDENGKAVRFVGASTDISDRVNLEERLHQSQKAEAIGNLTGGIAHDFNNLLAVTMGNLELLQDEIEDAEQLRMIDAGLEATRRGADLTGSMLSFARKARLNPVVVDLNNVVRHAKNWMRSGLPETVDIETSLLAGLWQVRLDTTMLESAILNLLLNAKDAMNAAGKLTIETANLRIDQAYADNRDQEIQPGRYVMIAVSDTGTGIPADVLPRIFDPFYSTKEVGKGSGMGLSMVEGFVKQSGGTVQIYTEKDQGTTFKLYFPALDSTPQDQTEPRKTSNSTMASGHHVLLVEDEPAVREVLAATLGSAGYQVTVAKNGDEALALYQQTPDFDVLVTDIVMPGALQGTGLAKAIRALNPELPMVFMSGYASEATVHGNGLRPQDIRLMKPVRKHDFLTAVASAIGQSEQV